MHKVENHCGLHSVNFLIYHIGMEVGIKGSLVICCAKSLCTAGSVAWKFGDSLAVTLIKNCYNRSFIELTFSKRRLSTFALVEKLYTNLHHRFLYCLSV